MINAVPTPAKPWPGEHISTPPYINGCTVVAAMAVPSLVQHEFAVIYVDNGRQGGAAGTLVVAHVVFTTSYRVVTKQTDISSYLDAQRRMLDIVGLDQHTAEAIDGLT